MYLVSYFSAYITWQEQVTFSLHNDACIVLDQHTGPDFYSYTLLKQQSEGITCCYTQTNYPEMSIKPVIGLSFESWVLSGSTALEKSTITSNIPYENCHFKFVP